MVLQQILAFRDFRIGHCVTLKTAFFCLNADVGHRLGRSAFDVAVTVGGDANHRTFGNVKHVSIDLKLAGSG